eukprot:jgi/Tetstr1/426341/TSEL_016654.t1
MARGGKKRCELGASCPYQHEGQHAAEFDHPVEPLNRPTTGVEKTARFQGSGRLLGVSRTAQAGGLGTAVSGAGTGPKRRRPPAKRAAAAAALRRFAQDVSNTATPIQHHRQQEASGQDNGEVIDLTHL